MFGCVKNVWSVSMISGENNVNVAEIAQFRYLSAWETGGETLTPKRGSGKYGANNKNKHCKESYVRLTNREILASFICPLQFIFLCTMVKYCAVALCRNGSKKRPDLSYFCFPTRPNERKKWEVFCKRADKKFKTLGDPRICSLHFKESDIEISISYG